jgi:Na+/H+-translocating membrane pyrophosphatase
VIPSRRLPAAVAADMRGGDSLRSVGDRLQKGVHGGNMVSPVLNPMIKITNIVAILIIPLLVSIHG